MSETLLLANRIREVLLDGKWIANTNLKTQIENIDWELATKKIGNLNTIAALTFHINYYVKGVLQVLEGGSLEIRDSFSFDMPPITSSGDWQKLVEDCICNSEAFAQAVEKLNEQQLQESFVDEKYGTYQRNIEGIIEHSYYHLGQISLMKKWVG